VTTLRASQIETLKAVRRFASPTVEQVALNLGRANESVERSLIRLASLGYLARCEIRQQTRPGGSFVLFSTYRLTTKGRSELSGGRES
jgi:predicted transcriptional regulator